MLYLSFLICASPPVQPCCALQRGDTANYYSSVLKNFYKNNPTVDG
jgi:hypothetical protein